MPKITAEVGSKFGQGLNKLSERLKSFAKLARFFQIWSRCLIKKQSVRYRNENQSLFLLQSQLVNNRRGNFDYSENWYFKPVRYLISTFVKLSPWLQTVWPDIEIKSRQKFLVTKFTFFKNLLKSQSILVDAFVSKKFQKGPIWSHWLQTIFRSDLDKQMEQLPILWRFCDCKLQL